MMLDKQVNHEADAATSIRQARRARAHRRRQCQTLHEIAFIMGLFCGFIIKEIIVWIG